jgi:uncharacterized protein (DUF1778 family)
MDAAVPRRRDRIPDPSNKTERIGLRVSVAQREMLSKASKAESTTLTEFILDAATTRAQDVLADRSAFKLNQESFAAFVELLDRPVVDMPRLRARLAAASPFDD